MSMVTEVEKMANEYISQVYKNMDENSLQYKEIKQAFIMGLWVFFLLSGNEKFMKEELPLMKAQIMSYFKSRMREIGHVNDDEYFAYFFKN